MRSQAPTRAGDQRHRLVRHHLPLATASAIVLVLFLGLPTFDTAANRVSVDLTSGPLPQSRGERGPEHESSTPGLTDHGAAPSASPGHGGDGSQPGGHGGSGQSGAGHGGSQGGGGDAGGQDGATDSGRGMGMAQGAAVVQRFTVATGYVATGLLALTLLIGPVNLVLRRRNPVSSYLRRDVGAWTAAFSIVHVGAGLQVHGRLSAVLDYFIGAEGRPLTNSFGLGNWTGLAATVIVVGLLALSSDFALRKLTARPWKRLQRLNYVLFALVLTHAFFYGALLRSSSPYTVLLVLLALAVFVAQAAGVWLWRRRSRRQTGNPVLRGTG